MSPRAVESPQELPGDRDPFERASIEHLVGRYGSPLFLIDADRIRGQYRRLSAALPGVDLYYAIKSLPHPSVVATLRDLGGCFDLAVGREVELVRSLGVVPERCIHTHPIKREGDIRTALAYGVTHFVVDNPDELRKFAKHRHRAALLIRVAFRSAEAVCDLSRKFGCHPEAVPGLLALASELRVRVAGLSFHAGSQAGTPRMHVEAIEVCRQLMSAASMNGHELSMLDIGGGFPVDYSGDCETASIEDFCTPIRRAIDTIDPKIRVIGEPGRFIAAPSAISVSSVMGRAERDGRWWYYLDDGLYGSYSGQMFDHARYPIEALAARGPCRPSVLAGPTCDSIDIIRENIDLPELEEGDLVVGRMMGAYTWATATEFNFFPKTTVLALDRGRLVRAGDRR
jgi:ornithine decarboxylase